MVCSAVIGIGLLPARAGITVLHVAFDQLTQTLKTQTGVTPEPSATPTAAATVTPGPTPTPVATAAPKERGGPLRFSLVGDVSFGETSTQSSFGSAGFFNTPTPSPGPTANGLTSAFALPPASASQSQSLVGAGATAEVSRRSARTYADLRLPLALTTGGRSAIGVASAIYSTPRYSVAYGPQLLNALGTLQLGATERGFEYIVPAGNGQATFYEGPTIGTGGETVDLQGVLWQLLRGGAFYEAGFTRGIGNSTGKIDTLLLGGATTIRSTAITGEAAWQRHSTIDGDPENGIAAQLRLDQTGLQGGCTTSLRSLPNNFVIFGGGEVPGDRLVDFNCHTTKVPMYADVSWERTGSNLDGFSTQKIVSLGYSPALRFGGFSVNVAREAGDSVGTPISSTSASASLSTQLGQAGALFGVQAQHTLSGGLTSDTRSLLGSLHGQIGQYNLGINAQLQTQSQNGVERLLVEETPPPIDSATGMQRGVGISVSRVWRRTSVQFGETFTRTLTTASDAIQRTPLVNLTYQMSPALSVQTSLGYQSLTDRLNPAANGKTRVISISLTGPFGIGDGLVTGRVDPNLPATIVGRVLVTGMNSGVGPALSVGSYSTGGGVGNVVVTLDGMTSERTDLTGGFQFSFVHPGNHTIAISTASIPRGFTAASPVQAIAVNGGQQADVTFPVSTLGGILGHVYGSEAGGVPLPLQGVRLQVDGGEYALTDAGGQFGFGGLAPGEHIITIIPQTVPATANFSPESLKAKATVSNGAYTTLDFHAQVLGSIGGTIVYAPDMLAEMKGGVPNAYVVAEPGDHAAIDEDDGSFVIDNLPPGDYTLSVDPETIDESLGATPATTAVHLESGQHYKGVQFSVGHLEKKVVFTLLGGATPPPALPVLRLSEGRLPPRGSTEVTVSADETAEHVAVTAFDKQVGLKYDKTRSLWIGEIAVPANTSSGKYPVTATVGKNSPKAVSLAVDASLPLVLVDYAPKNAREGDYVTIRARFLVEVSPGDRINWQDGDQTVLGKPVSGRVYSFRKKLTLLPLHGQLLTRQGPAPIEVL